MEIPIQVMDWIGYRYRNTQNFLEIFKTLYMNEVELLC